MTLVSIMGDFHSSILPVVYEYKTSIKRHILIHDDHSKDAQKADNFIKGIDIFKETYGFSFENLYFEVDEDSKKSIDGMVAIFKTYEDDFSNLYINTTDGLATINTLLSLSLVPQGAKIITYDRYDNEINIIDKDTLLSKKLLQTIPIKDYFMLRNIDITIGIDKNLVLKYKKEIQLLFGKYLQDYKQYRKTPIVTTASDNEASKIIQILLDVFCPSNLDQFLKGTLYELYVASLVSNFDIDDFEIGTTLTLDRGLLNEFDVLFMKNNHLHMIECKLAKANLNELIYKYAGLKHLLDDDGKIAIFSRHENYFREVTKKSDAESLPKLRAKHNDILTRGYIYGNEQHFTNDLIEFFSLKSR